MQVTQITYKNANIEIIDDGFKKLFVLKAGSVCKPMLPTFKNSALRNIRNSSSFNADTVVNDITFRSASAIASIIDGCSRNGNKALGLISNTPNTPNSNGSLDEQPKVECEDDIPKTPPKANPQNVDKSKLQNDIINFCKDFEYEPDPRVLDTMLYQNPNDLIIDTMRLINYPDELVKVANDKFDSSEWKDILQRLKSVTPAHQKINNRLKIYYGEAGTGKTTQAINDIVSSGIAKQDVVKIVGSASADPDEIFFRFDPTQKQYVPTEICKAYQNGTPIIVDEANFYPFEFIQRLQTMLDNTDFIVDRGVHVNHKDGFKIIVTMNLDINNMKKPLPQPFVSRAEMIKCFDRKKGQAFDYIW